MQKNISVAATLGLAAVLTVAIAAPANAVAWDGIDIEYGPAEWEPGLGSDSFVMEDVDLVLPDTSRVYTDIWDGMGYTAISSVSLSLASEGVGCEPDAAADVTTDAGTGDLLITCTSTNAAWATAGLSIVAQFRIYSGSDLVRLTHTITNTSGVDAVIDSVEFYTDFGSSGDLWNYQGQSDGVLAVPAAEDSASATALAGAGARWAIHFNNSDAPGGISWGTAGAIAPASVTDISGDTYTAEVSTFTIPAGASRTVAYFALWNPNTLIDGAYINSSGNGQEAAANALAPLMAEFDSFTGRLTVGLDVSSVVNWAPTPAPAKPVLAATGFDGSSVTLVAGSALAVLFLGAAVLVAVARRRTV